jgi:hypothetical protein
VAMAAATEDHHIPSRFDFVNTYANQEAVLREENHEQGIEDEREYLFLINNDQILFLMIVQIRMEIHSILKKRCIMLDLNFVSFYLFRNFSNLL